MYFKINTPIKDKYSDMGLVNISASFYLESSDTGWEKYQEEQHVIVPIFPEAGYPRQVELQAEQDAQMISGDFGTLGPERILYDTWVSELPTEERDNPFCNHAIQFEHDVTEEEILWCFEWALALTHQNYLVDDLHCKTLGKVVNQDIGYLAHRAYHEQIKRISESELTEDMLSAKQKIINANLKVEYLQNIDFTEVNTIANYNVR